MQAHYISGGGFFKEKKKKSVSLTEDNDPSYAGRMP